MSEEMPFDDDDQMLAAEYVLGLLSGEDLAEARRRLAGDPAFALSVTQWEIELSELAVDVAPQPVPAAAWRGLETRVFGAPDMGVPARLQAALAFWRGLSVVAVLLVAILGYLVVSGPDVAPGFGPSDGLMAAEITSDDGSFRYLAVLDEDEGVLQVTRISGTAPAGRVLQVWAHGDDQPAISVGLFGDGDTARLPLPPELRRVTGNFTMGMSEEPPGGSQQDGPSGQVMGRGVIAGL
ncbi:MAG: hypothetical protein CML68_03930 [Rhodobacteraceae bacterium]|nr:hypothetical protein [Paracoccaceae bacterium]